MRTLLRNALLIDGSGAPPFTGDVLVCEERIAEVGLFPMPLADAELDCTGLAISPGFIDSHSHSDLQVLEQRPEKVLQGVTTEVVGNCGFSPYPAPREPSLLREFANGIFCGNDSWGWSSAAAYLADVEKQARLTGVVSLLGHGSLRIFQAGHRLGALSEHDVQMMEGVLDDALSQGAAGFSTGLMYSPGESAPFEELERLCRVVARHGKIYSSHIRSYTAGLLEAVDEQLELARRTGCRLQISHLHAVGPANWSKQAAAIRKIEEAHDAGMDVAFDCYPYVAGSTVLTQLLPQWVLEGGMAGMLARLADPAQRAAIAAETLAGIAQRWSDLYISAAMSESGQALVGSNLEEIAEARGCEPVDAMLAILSEERGAVNVLEFNQTAENLEQLLIHPLAAIVSDGFYVRGRPHPRLHGTFAFLLGEICRNRNWLSLAEAIRKITGWPAQRFNLRDRGLLQSGYFADLVVFDAGAISSGATYERPEVSPTGIRSVWRNGRRLVEEGSLSGA